MNSEFIKMIKSDLLKSNIDIDKAAEIWKIGLSEYLIFIRPPTLEEIALKGFSIQNEPANARDSW